LPVSLLKARGGRGLGITGLDKVKSQSAASAPARRLIGQSKAPNCDDRHFALPATGNISHLGQINPSRGILSVEGNMIDALFDVAVFAMLALCIVGFSAWANKRVPRRS
jgi:hypothetical protein